jgi:hypothetical protein
LLDAVVMRITASAIALATLCAMAACRLEMAPASNLDGGTTTALPPSATSAADAIAPNSPVDGAAGGIVDASTMDAPPELGTTGCFAAGVKPPTSGLLGFAISDLDAERAAYKRFGWTWKSAAEPNLPADPTYSVQNPDIHGDTEGDDLFAYLTQYRRTGQAGYLDRAHAWARYGKDDLTQCVGGDYSDFCYDEGAFGLDHATGWGLLAYGAAMNDPQATAAAVRIGDRIAALWEPTSEFSCYATSGCIHYGLRGPGRHLILATRLAEVTGSAKFVNLRDRIIDKFLGSPEWDESRGTYFAGDYMTDTVLGAGAYAAGSRIQSSFQLGVATEALDHAYRVTGNVEIRRRLVKMAAFVEQYGLDPTYQYTASYFGFVGGKLWHSYSATEPVTYWDPVYTTSLVNTLMRGYRYTCETHFADAAKKFFLRGNGGLYGEPTRRNVGANEVDHFVDTRFDTSSGSFYFDFNKGELQYTYLIFDAP